MPTHGKPSQDESNIVLEFQSRVMSTFISDPAAWLRRERWHLKMDNSTTQPRGIKLDSNASHRTAPPDSVTESQVSSEDLTIENINENLVSPATIKSRSEHYQLLDSNQEPERDADYLALDHAGLSSTLLCQEFGFREDLPLEQLAYTDSQQRFCPNHPGQAQMEGCFKVVNTNLTTVSLRVAVWTWMLFRLLWRNTILVFRTTKDSWEMSFLVTLDAGILRTTSFEKHSDSLQSRRCCFLYVLEKCHSCKAKEEKQLSTGIFDSICDESKRQ
ncbi:hypothetical protein IWW34DRAFT_641137 [Fusarium oxysporum f. sp. albedinis]|nr:hypothetical protein IWW34DRAFT_641137 [Fusarium oxysporum f. sp. albedinis]